ncbi:amyloid-beta A4 precursor protein-binding family A member 2-like isoform X3 [Hydractinia symbiolongicarpus]|uniref:amyloid-beta A4 precursor protein-binding family A member 2-like isoform X3 n=1 Tax=Hydractinia symbiolongicarpus TaxID=13093 RepID=UPI00254F5DD0|nr:amyloid-beta A4 precursor protein-binding family A member 2-like isoform X3 [Hydractinia symbiolongicarpus]
MSNSEDGEALMMPTEKERHAAKVSDNDNAALLSSGEEQEELEEYTDIFADTVKVTGKIVHRSDLDEGESVSASEEEIMGYTGDVEMYTDVNDKEDSVNESDTPIVKEGTLISLNDEEETEVNETEIFNVPETMTKSLTNDSISEIATKLEEVSVSPASNEIQVKPGKPVKVLSDLSGLGFKGDSGSEISSHEGIDSKGGYASSGETSQQPAEEVNVMKKKKLRKHMTEKVTHENNIKDMFNSSGEFVDEKVNNDMASRLKRKEKRKKRLSESKDESIKNKLIDVDTPPQTPLHNNKTTEKKIVEPVTATKSRQNSQSKTKRKRTRHKIYLDDPDVHQLITDHVSLLQQFIEDTQSGKNLQKKHAKGRQNTYDICPDCGERHPPDDLVEVQDICPDCGVRHNNPYEHTPSPKWKKYVEACRDTLKPGQKYQALSTQQDPDDVKQDTLPSIEGPHTLEELTEGAKYQLKYLGSSQIITQHPVTKETRMQQAQEAYNRIKGQGDDEDEDDVSTNVNMVISLERIKIINKDTKFEDVMMDHALRTVCFICDMGKILVLMARRLTSDHSTDFSIEQGKPISLGSIVGDRENKTSKNICHVFECEIEASKIAKAIGQAFNVAYRQFLQTNGIAHEHVEEAEYCHVLESQKLVGADLDQLTDKSNARDVVVVKKRGDYLGIMLLESGWGSMLPTVFVAHLANYSAAARCQQLLVGDHILSCNGASLVGLPLSECNTILRNTRSSNRVVLRVVSCPPVVDVVVSRPDVKYQLGFSVQNGTICSLLRGGIAERGGVRVGHRIIEINGDSVVAKSHQHIVDILANTIGSISMKTMPVAMYRLMVGDDQPQHV